ncbi:MAG: NAD(P)-dependent oxidoreductase [Alphaproteobacteria bacterium]|nr:NAD(P)-dependent oxidoreductase [Alphaproteobacteria bacterium]
MKTISIIGLGLMGHGMARNILKAGFRLKGLAHHGNQNCDDLIAGGATLHDDLADVARGCDLLIICVTGSAEVEEVIYGTDGKGGIKAHAASGLVVMDCSTGLPQDTCRRARDLAASGITLFDAAMTRTPKEAREGRLNLILGGEAEVLARALPVMDSIAETITHAGPVGMGQEAKLIHNFVSLGFSAILGEAAGRAEAAGIDRQVFLELIGKGGGGGVVFDRFRPYLEHGDKDAFRFSLANAVKDLGYVEEMITNASPDSSPGGNLGDSLTPAVLGLMAAARAALGDDAPIPEVAGLVTSRVKG